MRSVTLESEFMQKVVKAALDRNNVIVLCQTCSLQFLDISLNDYLAYHDWKHPDKWFVETGIHWCENQEHLIFLFIPLNEPYNISDLWRRKMEKDHMTLEQMSEMFLNFRDQVKDKPI